MYIYAYIRYVHLLAKQTHAYQLGDDFSLFSKSAGLFCDACFYISSSEECATSVFCVHLACPSRGRMTFTTLAHVYVCLLLFGKPLPLTSCFLAAFGMLQVVTRLASQGGCRSCHQLKPARIRQVNACPAYRFISVTHIGEITS